MTASDLEPFSYVIYYSLVSISQRTYAVRAYVTANYTLNAIE